MPNGRINFPIESLELIKPEEMWAAFFINPAIALMESYQKVPFPIDVKCEKVACPLVANGNLLHVEIAWNPETFPNSQRLFRTIQRSVIVEYSAVAVALLLVTKIANCRVTEVTQRGDKADYFLDDRQSMLEISGTEDIKQIRNRYTQKRAQLLANPYQLGGYVVVCCFADQAAHFSFHLPLKDS